MRMELHEEFLRVPPLTIPLSVRELIWARLDEFSETPIFRLRVLFWVHTVRLKNLFPIFGRVVPRPAIETLRQAFLE